MRRLRPLRLASILSLLCPLGCLAVTAAQADDWTRFRGPTQTGVAAPGSAAGWPQDPAFEVVWTTEIGSGYSSIVVSDGQLFTGWAADGSDWLGAFDQATGEPRWRVSLGPVYEGHDGSHTGPIATPAVAVVDGRGMVYALGGHGRLVAATTGGEVEWSAELSELGKAPFYGFAASPVVVHDENDAVLVMEVASGEGPTVAGFDPLTGEVRWQAGDDVVLYQSPVVATLAGRRQVVASGLKNLYGLDPFSGEVLWSHEYGGAPQGMGSASNVPLQLPGDRLVVKHDSATTVALAVAHGDGGWSVEQAWSSGDLALSYVPAAYRDGVVYGYKRGFLVAVDAASGDTVWRSRPPGDGFLAVADGYLVVATKKGSLHLATASAEGWNELASLDLFDDPDADNTVWSDPIVAGGDIYVRSMSALARVAVRSAGDLGLQVADAGRGVEPPAGPFAEFLASLDAAADRSAAVDAFLAAQSSVPLAEAGHAIFLFRTDQESAGIEGAMLGDRTQGVMRRAADTDLFYFVQPLPDDAWVNYRFAPGFEDPVTDPRNPDQTTVMGQFGPEEFSVFTMPAWRPAPYLDAAATTPGRVVHHDVALPPGVNPGGGPAETEGQEPPEGEAGEAVMSEPKISTRGIDVYLPAGFDENRPEPYPVVFVPFGDELRTALELDRALDYFLGHALPEAVVVLVGFHDPRPGFDLFMGSEAAITSFHEQVVPYVLAKYPVAEEGPAHAYAGFAMAATHALEMGLDPRSRAGRLALVQPFFLDSQRQAYAEIAAARTEGRPHLYVETSPLTLRADHEGWNAEDQARRLATTLKEQGYEITLGTSNAAFAMESQRTRVSTALAFALTGSPEVPASE